MTTWTAGTTPPAPNLVRARVQRICKWTKCMLSFLVVLVLMGQLAARSCLGSLRRLGSQKRQACYPDSREPALAPSPGKTGKESPPSCPCPLLLSDAGGRTLSSNNLPLLNIKVEWLTKQLGRREEVYCVEQTLFSLQYQEIHSIQSGCRRLWRHLEPFFPSTWTSVAFNGTELQ